MNSKENSIGSSGDATVTSPIRIGAIDGLVDAIDKRDGLINKSLAAKHLSALLVEVLERKFGANSGQPGPHKDCRNVTIHDSQWLELQWLATEVWDACLRTNVLVQELETHATEICSATYDARKAVAA